MKYLIILTALFFFFIDHAFGQEEHDRKSISFGIDAKNPGVMLSINYHQMLLSQKRPLLLKIGIGTRHSYVLTGGLIGNLYTWNRKTLNWSVEYIHIAQGKASIEPNGSIERSLYEVSKINLLTTSLKYRIVLDKTLRFQIRAGYGLVLNHPSFQLISGPDDYSSQMNKEINNALILGIEVEFGLKKRSSQRTD